MKKEVRKIRGKRQFLLGEKDGERYWLEEASWDCDWYWGFGYVESYRGKGISDKSWRGHQHFDSLFLDSAKFVDGYKEFFDDVTLTDRDEIWKLLELMKSFYLCRNYSDMLHTGGAHITSNPATDTIKDMKEYNRINKKVIPEICTEVYNLLTE